ncbi:MAG: glycosyltransferase, partial [bacterium]
ILGIKVYKPDGELEQTARGFPSPLTGVFGRSTFLGKLAQRSGLGKAEVAKRNLQVDPSKTEPYEVDWVSGTVMLINRKCWDDIGGFDEDYFMYWEDADICARALKAGYKTVYFPGAQIFHEAGGSTRRDPVPAIRWFHQSAYKYIVKHISPGPSFVRAFGWCALNLRAMILIARARKKSAS